MASQTGSRAYLFRLFFRISLGMVSQLLPGTRRCGVTPRHVQPDRTFELQAGTWYQHDAGFPVRAGRPRWTELLCTPGQSGSGTRGSCNVTVAQFTPDFP